MAQTSVMFSYSVVKAGSRFAVLTSDYNEDDSLSVLLADLDGNVVLYESQKQAQSAIDNAIKTIQESAAGNG